VIFKCFLLLKEQHYFLINNMTDDNQTRMSGPMNDSNPTIMSRHGNDLRGSGNTAKRPYIPPKKKGFNKLLLLIPVVLFLFVIIGVVGYFVVSKYFEIGDVSTTEIVEQRDYSPAEALDALSGLDLPLTKIQEIERNVIHTGSRADEEQLNDRLKALKHLYSSEFMCDTHSEQNLRNIYMLHSTEFSMEQQNVMKWFLNLPANSRLQWEYVQGGVQDFSDFRRKMEAEMNRGQ